MRPQSSFCWIFGKIFFPFLPSWSSFSRWTMLVLFNLRRLAKHDIRMPEGKQPHKCGTWAASGGSLALKSAGSCAKHGSVSDPVHTALGPWCETTADHSAMKSQKMADDAALCDGLSSFFWGLSGRCSLGLYPHGEALLLALACPSLRLAGLGFPAQAESGIREKAATAMGILPLLFPSLLCPLFMQTHGASQSSWNRGTVWFSSQFSLFFFSPPSPPSPPNTLQKKVPGQGGDWCGGECFDVDVLSTRNLRGGKRNQKGKRIMLWFPLHPLGKTSQPAFPHLPWQQLPLNTRFHTWRPGRSSAWRGLVVMFTQLWASSSQKTCPSQRYKADFKKVTHVFLWICCPPCRCCVNSFLLQHFSQIRTPVADSKQKQQQKNPSWSYLLVTYLKSSFLILI